MSNFREFADAMAARFGYEPFTVEEARQINAGAERIAQDTEDCPVVHAWRTKNGSQLTFWCKHCKEHHFYTFTMHEVLSGSGYRQLEFEQI